MPHNRDEKHVLFWNPITAVDLGITGWGQGFCVSFITGDSPGVDFTKGVKTWHKFSTEIRFMLIPIIVLFIAHEFMTGNF